PQRGELEQRFAGLDATFVGYLKGEDLAAAYASADVFVYASEMETMGNVVLEAMAAGCPVVAPGAGGILSLLTHGATGFLYPARHRDAGLPPPGRRPGLGLPPLPATAGQSRTADEDGAGGEAGGRGAELGAVGSTGAAGLRRGDPRRHRPALPVDLARSAGRP